MNCKRTRLFSMKNKIKKNNSIEGDKNYSHVRNPNLQNQNTIQLKESNKKEKNQIPINLINDQKNIRTIKFDMDTLNSKVLKGPKYLFYNG